MDLRRTCPRCPRFRPGRNFILKKRDSVLSKVKAFIDDYLNPSSPNDELAKSIDNILAELDISSQDYYNALSISVDNDFQIHLKRSPDSCFVNNYFTTAQWARLRFFWT